VAAVTPLDGPGEPRDPYLIRQMSIANPLWVRPGSTASCSSSASRSARPRSADTCRGGQAPPRPGARSCKTIGTTPPPSTCCRRNGYASASLRRGRPRPRAKKSHPFRCHPKPTQGWLARQITEAFPWNTAPRFLLRDRDASYGQTFRDRIQAMAIEEVVTAPRSPWQNAYIERIIGSIRRECLNHVIISMSVTCAECCRILEYHHRSRTHLSLARIVLSLGPYSRPRRHRCRLPQVGGLHHRYERRAA